MTLLSEDLTQIEKKEWSDTRNVTWTQTVVHIPNEEFVKVIEEKFQKKIESLEKQIHKLNYNQDLELEDALALNLLRGTISKIKSEGVRTIDIFDLYQETK
ncbi:MAG: hypothetical protein WC595_04780, partial [Candidatus Nanoarchaeia archaeon]